MSLWQPSGVTRPRSKVLCVGAFTWEMVLKKTTPSPAQDVNNSIQLMEELQELMSEFIYIS